VTEDNNISKLSSVEYTQQHEDVNSQEDKREEVEKGLNTVLLPKLNKFVFATPQILSLTQCKLPSLPIHSSCLKISQTAGLYIQSIKEP
jgi:hypothetical protein